MGAQYATLADLTAMGIPAAAFGALTSDQKQSALNSASEEAEGYFRARYRLPLIAPFPSDLIRHVVAIATYNLMALRGYNPAAGGDPAIGDRMRLALDWLAGVERQRIHPKVIETGGDSPQLAAPLIISKPLQGW